MRDLAVDGVPRHAGYDEGSLQEGGGVVGGVEGTEEGGGGAEGAGVAGGVWGRLGC